MFLTQVSTTNAGVTLDPTTGAVNVAAGTPVGAYAVNYQICEAANPTNCTTSVANVTVNSNSGPVIHTHRTVINQGDRSLDLLDLVDSATDTEDGDVSANVIVSDDGWFDPDIPGMYFITFSVTDSDSNTTEKVETVIVNALPVANDDTASTTVNTAVDIDVSANDTDSDGTIDPTSVVITQQPQHGTLTVNTTTGVLSYTPNAGYTGTDVFQYTITDDHATLSNIAR